MTPKTRRLRRVEASRYLLENWGIRRTPKTLAKLAVTGGGPVFEKDGRFPLYTEPRLDDWARAQLSPPVSSTAELAAIRAGDGHAEPRCRHGGGGDETDRRSRRRPPARVFR